MLPALLACLLDWFTEQRCVVAGVAREQHDLNALRHAALQHFAQALKAFAIAVGERIVEYQRQDIRIGRLEHFGHGQAHCGR